MKEDLIIWSNSRVQTKRKINVDPNFWLKGCAKKKELMKKDHILLSNGRVQIKEINQCGP